METLDKTLQEYNEEAMQCRELFVRKTRDYGTAWRILRLPSLTDQLFIKAQRIRQLQELEQKMVDEGEVSEFMGLVNYSLMALIQLDLGVGSEPDLDESQALAHYDRQLGEVRELMLRKNHDYGEAWRDMRVSSLTDLILQKIFRIKQIEENNGRTEVSEGIGANYADIINYAIFALIHLNQTR